MRPIHAVVTFGGNALDVRAGGGPAHCRNLAAGLKANGLEVSVLHTGPNVTVQGVAYRRPRGASRYLLNSASFALNVWCIRRRGQPVVLTFDTEGALIRARPSSPVVALSVAPLGVWLKRPGANRVSRRIVDWLFRTQRLRRASAVIVNSVSSARDLQLIAPRAIVVRPGLDHIPLGRAKPQPDDRDLRLAFVGESRKGLLDLLSALEMCVRSDWQLDVAGMIHPADRDSVDRLLASSQRLSTKVNLHGPVVPDDVKCLLDEVDLLVSASQAETFGLAIGEAMRRGRPAIAYAAGAVPELVTRDNGWLVPPGNTVALSNAIDYACGHRAEVARKGELALVAVTNMTWRHTADAVLRSVDDFRGG